MKKANININFYNNPYRGIIKEVAEELNICRQTVYFSIKKKNNAKVLRLVNKKVAARQRELADANNQITSYIN